MNGISEIKRAPMQVSRRRDSGSMKAEKSEGTHRNENLKRVSPMVISNRPFRGPSKLPTVRLHVTRGSSMEAERIGPNVTLKRIVIAPRPGRDANQISSWPRLIRSIEKMLISVAGSSVEEQKVPLERRASKSS